MERVWVLFFSVGLVIVPGVTAHEITALSVKADFQKTGEYGLELGLDVKLVRDADAALPLSVPGVGADTPLTEEEIAGVVDQVAEYLETTLRFYFGDAQVKPAFAISGAEEGSEEAEEEEDEDEDEELIPMRRYVAVARGVMPEGAEQFLLEVTPEARAPVVFIIFKNGKPTRHSQVLYSGEFSRPVELATLKAVRGEGVEEEVEEEAGEAVVGGGFMGYVGAGVAEILPRGFPYILFLLGMFLTGERFQPLLWQLAAYTAGHSLVLAMGVLGVVAVPGRVVEVIIALSVAYVGVENVVVRKMTWWRVPAVFVFGLAHGLGFAEGLTGLGVAEEGLISALVGFNVGIVLGEVAVILMAILGVCWFWRRSNYRKAVIIPASALIGLAGLYWAFERVFFLG